MFKLRYDSALSRAIRLPVAFPDCCEASAGTRGVRLLYVFVLWVESILHVFVALLNPLGAILVTSSSCNQVLESPDVHTRLCILAASDRLSPVLSVQAAHHTANMLSLLFLVLLKSNDQLSKMFINTREWEASV